MYVIPTAEQIIRSHKRWSELFDACDFDNLHKELHTPDVILYPPGKNQVVGDGNNLKPY